MVQGFNFWTMKMPENLNKTDSDRQRYKPLDPLTGWAVYLCRENWQK